MSKTNLVAVLEKLIKEGPDSAQDDLHKYFVETCVEINESLNENDSEDDSEKEDESNEKVDECDMSSEDEVEEASDESDVDASDAAAFDADADAADDAADDAAVDASDDVDLDAAADAGDVDLEDKVDSLEAELADLQAQFMALTGQGPVDSDTVEIDPDEGDDTLVVTDDGSVSPIDGEEDTEESIQFEDSDFADLDEAYQLEKVKDPNLNGSKEIGADGQKISVNDKSPTLQKKVGDRIGGEPVEIIADEHNGYDREASPGVKDVTIAKNQQKKATQDLKGVSKEGDKSALINNTGDGFGADNTKSPVVATKSLQK